MFRKIIIILVVLLPAWYSLFIGYPVISDQQFQEKVESRPGIVISRRCSAVGDFRELRNCLAVSERMNGEELLQRSLGRMGEIDSVVPYIVLVSSIVFILASVIVLVG